MDAHFERYFGLLKPHWSLFLKQEAKVFAGHRYFDMFFWLTLITDSLLFWRGPVPHRIWVGHLWLESNRWPASEVSFQRPASNLLPFSQLLPRKLYRWKKKKGPTLVFSQEGEAALTHSAEATRLPQQRPNRKISEPLFQSLFSRFGSRNMEFGFRRNFDPNVQFRPWPGLGQYFCSFK